MTGHCIWCLVNTCYISICRVPYWTATDVWFISMDDCVHTHKSSHHLCHIMIIQQHCLISTLQYSGMVLYTHFSYYLYEVKVGYKIYTVSSTPLPSILSMPLEPPWRGSTMSKLFTANVKYMTMVELIRWTANSKRSLVWCMFSYCNYLLQSYHAHGESGIVSAFECYSSDKG